MDQPGPAWQLSVLNISPGCSGGGTGIGRAITEELLSLGAKVVIASRSEEKVAAAAAEMRQLGTVESLKCNIRKEEDVR